ncbi:MAG: DUF3348 domain-containing protein [Burkholderiales bacterium]|nr:DUF3348 domain-containing protein [Burkholderiales bacterium]
MTRTLTRTNLHSSRLTRILADLGAIDAKDPGPAFAEQLGQWVDFKSAIALSAVHNAGAASLPEQGMGGRAMPVQTLEQEFARIRAGLEQSMGLGGAPKAGGTRMEMPLPMPGASVEEARAYAPYRRYHQALQRDLETKVGTLRAKVRDAVTLASPKLRQLAALDAAFEGVLVEREAKLLATVPSLLEKRFNQLLKAHQQATAQRQQADSPELWVKPGGWLMRFCHELQSVLLAELDLRLQPALGLLEAFHNEKIQQA